MRVNPSSILVSGQTVLDLHIYPILSHPPVKADGFYRKTNE